jgi:Tfp pilus assembly pilus retraction ATPase PilT
LAGPARLHARTITSILVEAGVVTPEQVDAGLVRQRSTGLRIGESLVEMGAATEVDIGWALARQLGLTFVDLIPESLDRDLIRSFPEGLLSRLDAVPLVIEEPALSVALADPTDAEVAEELERAAGRPLKLAVATTGAIRRVLREILGSRRDPLARPSEPALGAGSEIQRDRAGSSYLNSLLTEARLAGVTEIHFVPKRGGIDLHQRAGGRLTRVRSEPPDALYSLLARIEALGGPMIDDRVAHASGRIVCPVGTEAVDLGISLLHQDEGLSVTLELLPVPTRPPALEALGFDPIDLARLRAAVEAPAGLGVITGPPRSGGSTTLGCLLSEAGTEGRRAIAFGTGTPHVATEVRTPAAARDVTRAWAEAAVAQCADVIVLDGVLPGETVEGALAVESAGRLVLVRTDWIDTFALLEHLAARPRQRAALADRLLFVVQQRLLRADGARQGAHDGGLRPDRRGAFEVLIPGEALREALRAGEAAARLRALAAAEGFQPLATRLRSLVDSGEIGADEAARALA